MTQTTGSQSVPVVAETHGVHEDVSPEPVSAAGLQVERVLAVCLPVLTLVVVLGFWQVFVVWAAVPSFIFPRLDDTLASLRDHWSSIWSNLQVTLEEAGLG